MEWSSIYNLTQFWKVYIKSHLIVWFECSTSFNNLLFFSLQRVQNKHNGVTLKAFICFLSKEESRHPKRFPLTKESITQTTPKRQNINYHNILALEEWSRKEFIVSPQICTKKTNSTKSTPSFWANQVLEVCLKSLPRQRNLPS